MIFYRKIIFLLNIIISDVCLREVTTFDLCFYSLNCGKIIDFQRKINEFLGKMYGKERKNLQLM